MFSKLDAFNFQIVAQHFCFSDDYLNAVLVCKKFACILDRFRYNPIPVTSTRLFPCMETQYLYTDNDVELQNIQHFVVLYPVDYSFVKSYSKDTFHVFKNIRMTSDDFPSQNSDQMENKSSSNDSNENALLEELHQNRNIKILGNGFMGILNIKDFDIPKHITELEEAAFSDNTSLESVTFCDGLTSIPNSCFSDCVNLKTINLPPTITSIESKAFKGCGIEEVTLSSTIMYVGSAFMDCVHLKKVSLPKGIKTIETSTFANCSVLSKVELPAGLLEIKSCAFEGCKSLEEITIPQSVYIVGNNAFANCEEIKELVFGESCVIEEEVFVGCTGLTKLIVPTTKGKVNTIISREEEAIYKKFYENVEVEKDWIVEAKNYVREEDNVKEKVCYYIN
ncbi:hypothetical protein EIN_141400 [Entamoeba invadens IP1]|uniref:Leucine rich repeat containing protein BspA family protein n=1 Tax=Entamoeba invadens IP1 TaxID=370355 RepID=A0A0A1UFJ6_ENTIV|nr:hypothetical protein EIN_141400 [Entamoeba invadens IP1]ELP95298.1 hypothetical protein EIN_141400 [Entamoeba invadens IP1]|eukprot:XP_004262069.1 hypothetical protein EIN_141400 [Entamoeba invadens IP1]